ncbi:protein kinase activating protein dpb11 [Entomophthora muscae]|uniref:Protein kinase activating protein dpb11 n=1 Tax=Entomophthora muscae TaxID=34485 RepID=A0ACC2RWM6_9FUNG|nr:protein kinase activating protein dpb11 [Entomophthora muscae]
MQVSAKGGMICNATWLESLLASIPTALPSQLSATGLDTQQGFKFPLFCFFYLSHDFKSKESYLFKERLLSLGAKIANQFNRLDATHYFIAASVPSKNEKEELDGFMKGIKVVNQEWLEKCIKSGQLLEPLPLKCEPLLSTSPSSNEATFWNRLRVGKAEESGQCTRNESAKTIFRGLYFSMVGLDPSMARFAQEAIALRGGEIVNIEILVSPRVIILPFRGLELGNSSVEKSEISSLVTAYWLQRCIDCNKLIDPSSHVLYSPLSAIDSLEGFSDFHVTVTGFSGMKRVLLMGLVRNLGGHWTESMTHKTTHLICSEFKGGKYDLALKKKALVVTENWLFHVAETRNVKHALVLQAIPQEHNPHFSPSKIADASLASTAVSSSKKTSSTIGCSLSSAKPTPTKSSILKGVVFFLYPSSEYNTAELIKKAHSMGATSLKEFELNKVTHLIVSGSKDYSASRTFRCAVQNSIIVVNQFWIEKCFETGHRQDELKFLYTQAPRRINRTNSAALQQSKPKIESDLKDKVSPCSIQPKAEKQQIAQDLLSSRLSAIIKETYKRKNQVCSVPS